MSLTQICSLSNGHLKNDALRCKILHWSSFDFLWTRSSKIDFVGNRLDKSFVCCIKFEIQQILHGNGWDLDGDNNSYNHRLLLSFDFESGWCAFDFFLRGWTAPPPSINGMPMRDKSLCASWSVLAVVVMQTSIPLGWPTASKLISGNTLWSLIPML